MRSRTKYKLSHKTADGWFPWFAWRPIKVEVPIIDPNDPYRDRAWITVWLEYVEWKQDTRSGYPMYQYRFKEPQK
jgi:hypothetical protein